MATTIKTTLDDGPLVLTPGRGEPMHYTIKGGSFDVADDKAALVVDLLPVGSVKSSTLRALPDSSEGSSS